MKNVYDNSIFFNEYQEMRSQEINANNLIEIPIMKSIMPELNGKTILDLGCGCGDMDKYFVEKGAKKVLATDISENMIATAKQINTHKNIEYQVLKMENLNTLNEKFDIVYSSLAFHYIEDFNKLLNDIYNILTPNGLLIFSQESPLTTMYPKETAEHQNKVAIDGENLNIVKNYCKEGERQVYWNNTQVTKYHRTYANIVNSLIKNNFEIIEIKDSYATEDVIKICAKYKNQINKPYFTFVKVRKKSN